MPKFSGRPQTYDRDALHSFLFRHANSRGVIKVHQRLLAEELGCSPTTLRNLLWELKLLNKIERVVGPGPCAHYRVNEPEKKARSAQKKKSRTPMWG